MPRRRPDRVSTYRLLELSPRHKEVLRRLAAGHRPTDVARDMGYQPCTVSGIKHSRLGQERLARLEAIRDGDTRSLIERICENAETGSMIAERLMIDEAVPSTVRAKLAMDAMNRDRRSAPIQRREAVVAHLTSAELLAIQKRSVAAIESLKVSGLLAAPASEDTESGMDRQAI